MKGSASTAQPTHVIESGDGCERKGDVEEQLRRQCAAFDIDYVEPGAPPYQIELQTKEEEEAG